MSRQTPLLFHPTIDEVKLQCAKIGLPYREGEKFWHHYNSNGWCVGKTKMKNWHSALSGWKLRWEDRRIEQHNGTANDVTREIKQWRREK